MKFDSNYAHFLFCEHLFENVTANFGHVIPRAIQTRQAALDWNVMLYTDKANTERVTPTPHSQRQSHRCEG